MRVARLVWQGTTGEGVRVRVKVRAKVRYPNLSPNDGGEDQGAEEALWGRRRKNPHVRF